jgi:ABC-type multidrug transport system permease subunit
MQGAINLLFSIFLVTHLFSSIDFLVILHFIKGRELFEGRERHSQSYSWIAFITSNVIVEVVWQTVIAAPIFAVWYCPLELYQYSSDRFSTTERGDLTFAFIWLFNLWASSLSQAVTALIENSEVAMQIATLIYWMTILFAG